MHRSTTSFIIDNAAGFKQQALRWADKNFSTVVYFDNNKYADYPGSAYEGLIAAGVQDSISLQHGGAFEKLKAFYESKKDWLFGFLGYDLKNEIERLHSKNRDALHFPEMFFFQPQWVIEIHNRHAVAHAPGEAAVNLRQVFAAEDFTPHASPEGNFTLHPRITREEYLRTVQRIQQHIARGDIYEMNYCQEFFTESATLHPLDTFIALNELSKAPFSCYMKHDEKYLLCASPERFLKKEGNTLVSMPMKGTAKRGKTFEEDTLLRAQLRVSQKERSENVMIVDVVRNDLSRSCAPASVRVEELCGIKTFEQVHQMVSTISGTLREGAHFVDAIKNAFPMGSMTGAPKTRAMQLIERYERSKRGLYSGATGYITPAGDFDFNVVIRSLLYNAATRYLSCHTGSAITINSIPEKEYDECLLKARALRQALKAAARNTHTAAC